MNNITPYRRALRDFWLDAYVTYYHPKDLHKDVFDEIDRERFIPVMLEYVIENSLYYELFDEDVYLTIMKLFSQNLDLHDATEDIYESINKSLFNKFFEDVKEDLREERENLAQLEYPVESQRLYESDLGDKPLGQSL